MFETFIKRPVLSLVISLIIVLVGLLALFTLPVTQFPDIVPPSVTVTAKYTGANAEVCAKAVATPLERAINGVPGMTYMSSVSSNNGITLITVSFKVGTDPDQAAVNVQNRVTTVLDELPEEVIKAGVTTEKEVNSMLLYLNIMSKDSTADEQFIYNFADINILQELKRIDGVGFAEIMGSREYSMRVWLKPDRMVAYNVSAQEVIDALRSQNVEAAPGKTGESSGKDPQALQYVLKYTGKYFMPAQYEDVVIRAENDGAILRLKDVADVEFGSMTYGMISKTDGRPSASIMLKQRPGSNARDVIANVKSRMAELKSSSFPPGMEYNFAYDVSRFLDASIGEVIRTLFEALILVFIVVFIFLQDFRSTLIPALAVPVALIGTLCFMQLMGFSINLLTLFALVLAIGIVVDNAIVVVEAVHVKMAEHHLSAMDATIAAMKEISGAIVAITLVMSAVFVPVAFLSGPVGVFYRQFSLTLAIAIVISGINAVTLTPALCALMLKHTPVNPHRKNLLQRFFAGFNKRYAATENRYQGLVVRIAGRRGITVALLFVFFVATWGVGAVLPGGFIPTEDQGMIYVNVTTPAGSTVERTEQVLTQVQKALQPEKAVENISTLSGYSLVTEVAGASYGMAMINLKPWKERKGSLRELMAQMRERTKHIRDASIEFFPPPTVPGFGNSSGFELRVLDKTGSGNLQRTAKVTHDLIGSLKKDPAIGTAFTSFDPSFPQYLIHVDADMAAKKGVTVDNAMSTLQTLLGSYYATNFIRFGQMYKVMVQAYPGYRAQPDDIVSLYVKNNRNEMVPYSTFIQLERVYGPEQLTRYNMYNAAMVNGDASAGHSSGEAIAAIEKMAKEKLPRGFSYEWSGMTREQILSGNQAVYIFLICLVFVYLLLAAQYESFLLPMPVILSLPTGIFGAFLALKLAGLENNIYAQVALVMLIGLLGKNAILIVEFAILRRKQGFPILQAAKEGAVSRLRPILMTSFAFIAGLIPLCIASGAGAMGNRSIGTAAAGGMLIGTVFGVVLIPGLYVLFAQLAERKQRKQMKPILKQPITVVMMGALLLVISGCSVPRQTVSLQPRALPERFTKATPDSSGIARLSWRRFFSDTLLASLIDTAIRQNTDMQRAMQRIAMARAQLQMSKGAMLPTVDAAVSGSFDRYGKYTLNGVGNFDTNLSPNIDHKQQIPVALTPDLFVGLRSSWEADIWGKLKLKKKAAYLRYLATEKGRQWTVTQLVSQVAALYYELLSLDREKAIITRNIQLQEKALEVVQAQKAGGRATELAVQQFHAQLYNTRSALLVAQQQIVQAENALNLLAGRFPAAVQRAAIMGHHLFPDTVQTGTPLQLLSRRPDIQEAELELAATGAETAAARKAFLPSLQVTGYTAFNAFSAALLFSPGSGAYGFLGALTMPVLNRSQLKTQYALASASQADAFYRYQQTVLQAFREVATHLEGIQNYRQAYQLKQEETTTLQAAVSTAHELYTGGYASYLEVISAHKGVLEAELGAVQYQQSVWKNWIGQYPSLGGGWN